MALPLHTLDVFTDRRFCGNPLAVVTDADALGASDAGHRARAQSVRDGVRAEAENRRTRAHPHLHARAASCRSPATRLSARHPAGSAAHAAGQRRARRHHRARAGVGPVRVGVRLRDGTGAFAEFDAPSCPRKPSVADNPERIAEALACCRAKSALRTTTRMCITAGNTFAFVPVQSLDAIRRARVERARWDGCFRRRYQRGLPLYPGMPSQRSAFHARMFAPQLGVPEDPATGSAAVCLAGVVHDFDGLPDGTHKRVIEQGHEMGRPSTIVLTLIVSCRQARNGPHRRQRRARHRWDAGPRSPADQLEIGKA